MAAKFGLLKQGAPEEEQQQRWNTREEQQDKLGEITKNAQICKGVKKYTNF